MLSLTERVIIHPDIVDKETQYLCIKCWKGLSHPKQLLCGHRICSPCLEQIKHNSSNPGIVLCPAKSVEDCEDSPINKIFIDKSIEKDMMRIKVYCPYKFSGCDKVFLYSQLQDHLKQNHLSNLPNYPSITEGIGNRYCKFSSIGCQKYFEQDSDLSLHELDVVAHMDIILQRFDILDKENSYLVENLKLLNEDAVKLKQQQDCMDKEYAQLSDITEKLQRIKIQQEETLAYLKEPYEQSQNIQDKTPFVLQDETRNELIEHVRTLGIHDVSLVDISLKLKMIEDTSYTGTLIWKVENYHSKKNTMDNKSLMSPIFFTSRYGYKMMCRAYLNGDGPGRGTHLSLFFALLRSHYDDILKWPFSKRVSFTLVDQGNATKDVIYSFDPDCNNPSFQRPKATSNIAFGCPLFVRHSDLENPNETYLKNDTFYLRIVVGSEAKQTNVSIKN